MKYTKIFIKTHLKYWYVYIALFILFFPSYAFMLVPWMLVNLKVNGYFAFAIGFVLGGFFLSSPLLFTNYKAATEMKKNKISKFKTLSLTLVNHIPSFLIFTTIYIMGFVLTVKSYW